MVHEVKFHELYYSFQGSDLSAITCLYIISRLLQVVGGKSLVNSMAGIVLYPSMTSCMRDSTREDSGNRSCQDKSFLTHLNKLEMQLSGLESKGAENIERNRLFGHLLDYVSSNSHFFSCPWDNELGERSVHLPKIMLSMFLVFWLKKFHLWNERICCCLGI